MLEETIITPNDRQKIQRTISSETGSGFFQKTTKTCNFEGLVPNKKNRLFKNFIVSIASLGPKPPKYPALARIFYFEVSVCFGTLQCKWPHFGIFQRCNLKMYQVSFNQFAMSRDFSQHSETAIHYSALRYLTFMRRILHRLLG